MELSGWTKYSNSSKWNACNFQNRKKQKRHWNGTSKSVYMVQIKPYLCKRWKRKQTHIFHLSGFFRLQPTNSIECSTISGCNQRKHAFESQTLRHVLHLHTRTIPTYRQQHTSSEMLMQRKRTRACKQFQCAKHRQGGQNAFFPRSNGKAVGENNQNHSYSLSFACNSFCNIQKVFRWVYVRCFGIVIQVSAISGRTNFASNWKHEFNTMSVLIVHSKFVEHHGIGHLKTSFNSKNSTFWLK